MLFRRFLGPISDPPSFLPLQLSAHLRRPAEGLGLDRGPPKRAHGPASSKQATSLSLPRASCPQLPSEARGVPWEERGPSGRKPYECSKEHPRARPHPDPSQAALAQGMSTLDTLAILSGPKLRRCCPDGGILCCSWLRDATWRCRLDLK